MPNYQNGKIYAIRSHKTPSVYIGSTTVSLSHRFAKHRYEYNCKGNRFTKSCELLKYADCYIELLEKCPCNDRSELLKKEGEYIRGSKFCVNKQIAGQTQKEYRLAHLDTIKAQLKVNYQKNKHILLEPMKCECGSTYSRCGKSRHLRRNKHIKYIEGLYDIEDIQKLYIL